MFHQQRLGLEHCSRRGQRDPSTGVPICDNGLPLVDLLDLDDDSRCRAAVLDQCDEVQLGRQGEFKGDSERDVEIVGRGY